LSIEIDGVLLHHGFMFGHLRVGIWCCAYLSVALGFLCFSKVCYFAWGVRENFRLPIRSVDAQESEVEAS
jgi:hypothetical protein